MQQSSMATPPTVRAAHVHAPEIEKQNSAARALRLSLITIAGVLLALVGSLTAYGLVHNGKVYKGVSVLGADLSGMSNSDAKTALASAAQGYPSSPLTVNGAGHTWTFSPADLGLAVDVDKTLESAVGVGREAFPANIGAQLGGLFGGAEVMPALKYDPALLDKAVAQIAAETDKPAVDSKLAVIDGKVVITPSSDGTVVDRDAAKASLTAALVSAPFAAVDLPMKTTSPRITEALLNKAQAHALLLTDLPIVLRSDNHIWTITPDQLRDMLDVQSPASDGGEASVMIGNSKLSDYLQPIAEDVKILPKDATVVVGKGTVTLNADVPGVDLNVQSTITAIQDAAESSDATTRIIDLPLLSVPASVHTADAQPFYDKVNGMVNQGVRVRFRDDGYFMRTTSVTGFLNVARTQDAPYFKLNIDSDVLSSRISGIATSYINRSVADARFRMVNNAPTKVASAAEGFKVNVGPSVQNVLKAIDTYTGGDRLQADLDVTVTEPTVKDVDLTTVRTPDLLGTGQTSYAGSSAERAWNVGLGTQRINGALIPPGGTFSTSDTIGELTLAAGFKMGYAIMNTSKGLTTVPAEAGGICQVATTLFHSVFWSGLHVVERNWHSYWIGSYGVKPSGLQGLDATIAPPYKDFRFQNNTGNWILINSVADGKTVTFQLYGVNPNWKVSVSGPTITNRVKTNPNPITETSDKLPLGKKVLVEHAQDGFNASITRVVTDKSGGVVDKWVANSSYAPAHNRYLVGTGPVPAK